MIKVGVALSSLALLMTSALAAGPITGVWHGHISFDTTKIPPTTDATQKSAMMKQVQTAEQIKITLTLKGDHTFSIVTIGGPGKQEPTSGTYSATGSSVTIHPVKAGKPGPAKTFALSKDGHSFSFSQGPLNITFSK